MRVFPRSIKLPWTFRFNALSRPMFIMHAVEVVLCGIPGTKRNFRTKRQTMKDSGMTFRIWALILAFFDH